MSTIKIPTTFPIVGRVEPGFERLREVFQANFDAGEELGAGICCYVNGKKVVDLEGGYFDETYDRVYAGSLQVVFSSSKLVESILVAHEVDQGNFDYDDKIAQHWPEFAQGNKENVLVKELMAHRGGVEGLKKKPTPKKLQDLDAMAPHLAAQPHLHGGKTTEVYHAWTRGFYANELVRRTDPKKRDMGQLVQQVISKPLGLTFYFGTPSQVDDRISPFVLYPYANRPRTAVDEADRAKGIPAPPPGLLETFDLTINTIDVTGLPPHPSVPICVANTRDGRILQAPSTNGVTNARSLARIGAAMANGGSLDGVTILTKSGMERAAVKQPKMEDGLFPGMQLTWAAAGWANWENEIVPNRQEELVKWNSGVKCFEANDYERALDYFEAIPETSKISFNIGMAFLQIGHVDDALKAFSSAVRKDTYLSIAYFQRGWCYFRTRRYEEAFNDYDLALEKMRGVRLIDYTQLGLPFKLYSSHVQFNRGLCFIKLGSVNPGLEDLDDAYRDRPKDSKADNERIEQAQELGPRSADKLSLFDVPPQLLYKPPASKIENTAKVDYLGSSKVVAAVEAADNFTGFSGKRLKAATLDRNTATRGPLDDVLQVAASSPNLQRAATASARSRTIDTVRGDDSNNDRGGIAITRSKTIDTTRSAATLDTRYESNNNRSMTPTPPKERSYASPTSATTQSSQPTWTTSRGGRASPEAREPEPQYIPQQQSSHDSSYRPRKQSLKPDGSPYGQTRRPSEESEYGNAGSQRRPSDNPSDYAGNGRRPSGDREYANLRRPSDLISNSRTPTSARPSSPALSSPDAGGRIKLKCHYGDDTFMMLIAPNTLFPDLSSRIEKKFQSTHPLRLRYVDEDGEKVLMTDQEDMELALRLYGFGGSGSISASENKLEIWCSNE
ncbi:hypothetical protein SmJEL517_g03346 [Synchytrium microbalum]|uniref:PB1 domain-containing protein n=1 Tax=Synchytrium microbalum TaxID=1806994 RepID=A0A507C8G5_9FUNG|nr:uncharacterized protein SmJEL517_g03346 [Synchytrium microbalum]TPX33823.1 hypothetical protein SmJEL517_g03346 [Synchytrium microbalum]